MLYQGLEEAFDSGSIDQKEHEKIMDRCWAKRAKPTAEDLTITPRRCKPDKRA